MVKTHPKFWCHDQDRTLLVKRSQPGRSARQSDENGELTLKRKNPQDYKIQNLSFKNETLQKHEPVIC